MSKVWLSPAKINLFLHIINKRDDGYHNLETIFQLLDYYDELKFVIRDDGIINISGNENVSYADDLIVKSAKLLQQKTKTNFGVDININKKIPLGGGLGGGSSNAATTLIALNKLWDLQLSKNQLMEIGLSLGADVPIFVFGFSAWASGIGDKLAKIPTSNNHFLVVDIGKHVSTREIFSHFALTKTPSIGKICAFSDLNNPHNDCTIAAVQIENEVLQALKHLKTAKNYLYEPRMSGTGGCVFVEFKEKKDALVAFKNLPGKYSGFVAKAINISPVL